jgi:hypothetical protein
MQVESRTLAATKAGNAQDDYEDAAWPLRSVRRNTRAFRCAVADGATEASFSGAWARLLVRAFCARRLAHQRFETDVAQLVAAWREQVGAKPLPWYAEEKLRSGAFSSLLGFWAAANGRWDALAVGDSCLVQVRQGAVCAKFPITTSADFSSRPHLLGTAAGVNANHPPETTTGLWQPGDTFYLMTDAIAAWSYGADERGEAPWRLLDTLSHAPAARFHHWLTDQRHAGNLRNDDVTLLHLVLR